MKALYFNELAHLYTYTSILFTYTVLNQGGNIVTVEVGLSREKSYRGVALSRG